MPDNQKDLKVNIETLKSGQGAEQTTAELTKLTGATADAGKATGKLGEGHEETAHSAEHSEINHRLLIKTFGELGETGRAAGESLIAMGEGPIGGLLILGIVVNQLTEYFGRMAEKIQEVQDRQSELSTATWDNQREALDTAAESANNFAKKLGSIATETDKVKQQEQLELAVLNAQQDAQKKILEAREKAELAAAGGDRDKEDAIRRRYGSQASAAELADEAARINQEGRQRSDRMMASGGLKSTATNTESAYESALNDPTRVLDEAKLKQLAEEQGELDKKAGRFDLPALRKQLETADTAPNEFGRSEADTVREQIQQAQEAKKAADDNRAKVAELNGVVEQQKTALDNLKEKAGKTSDAYVKNETAINELTAKIIEATAVYDVHLETAKAVKETEAPGTPFGKGVRGEEGDALMVLHGQAGQVSTDSQDLMKQIGALMAGHSVTLQQAAQMISNANSNAQTFTQALDRMNGTAQSMEKFSAASAQHFAQIMSKMDEHTRKIELLLHRSNSGANLTGLMP